MGRQVFTAGEILTAANMNDLSDQTVMVFDDSAARDSAIPTPSEGMVTYLKDTDSLELFDGVAFGPFGGKVLQVVQAVKTDAFSSASNTFVDVDDLSVTITPSATANKVFVESSAIFHSVRNVSTGLFSLARIVRVVGGVETPIVDPINYLFSTPDRDLGYAICSFLDSPSTTSAVSYKLQVRKTSSANFVRVNRHAEDATPMVATITASEVAG